MVGIQGLVNGWVRVNKTHMNIPQQQAGEGNAVNSSRHGSTTSHSLENSGTNESTSSIPSASGAAGGNGGSNRSLGKLKDAETEAIRRQHHGRRKNRKLQRTVSHTDLLREMAKEKEVEQRQAKQDEADRKELKEGLDLIDAELMEESLMLATDRNMNTGVGESIPPLTNNDGTDASLRRVANFFGADLLDPQQHNLQPQQSNPSTNLRPVNTGKFLNEAAFVQQYESTLMHNNSGEQPNHAQHYPNHHQRSQSMETSSSNVQYSKEEEANLLAPMRATPPLQRDARSQQSYNINHNNTNQNTNPMQQWFGGLVQPKPHKCHTCEEYESRLIAANADLDYLRSVALRNEYTCSECRNLGNNGSAGGSSTPTVKQRADQETLGMLSKRMQDLTMEKKLDVEEESAREAGWHCESEAQLSAQQDSSKKWMEEAHLHKQQAVSLQQRLEEIRIERDELRTETTRLSRRVQLFEEREMKELKELKELMVQYESSGLSQAQLALKERDATIADLSTRLEQTLATLELERRQQQQRRQIILPTNSSPSSGSSGSGNEVRHAREAAAKAKAEVERMKAEMERKEQVWMQRLQAMERQQLDQQMSQWS